jgi:hypothetical protein
MEEIELEKQRIIMNERMRRESFLSIVGAFEPEEKDILRILITDNAAYPIGTIRNRIIEEMAKSNKNSLLLIYGIKPEVLTNIEKKIETTDGKLTETEIKAIAGLKAEGSDGIDLVFSFLSDETLIKLYKILRGGYGGPESLTSKIKLWEKALKHKLKKKVPSWDGIDSAMTNLKNYGLVDERKVIGKNTDTIYFIPSALYNLYEELQKKPKKTAAEAFWFS